MLAHCQAGTTHGKGAAMRNIHVGWGRGVAYRWILVALTGALLGQAAAQPSCAPGAAPSASLVLTAQAQGPCCSIVSVDTKPAPGVSLPPESSSGGGAGSGSAGSQWLAYVRVLDGLEYRPRPGLTIYGTAGGTSPHAWAWCKSNFYVNLVGHTDANGQAVLAIPAYVRPCQDNHGRPFNIKCVLSDMKVTGVANKDQWGWDVLVLPGTSFGDEVDNGGTITFSNVTPQPERRDLSDPHYGGASRPNTSELLTLKGGSSLGHPVGIVSGMSAAS